MRKYVSLAILMSPCSLRRVCCLHSLRFSLTARLIMDRITFSVNGIKQSVGCEVKSTTTLLDYLRRTLELRGTKYMCLEGGCGACIVSVTKHHGDTPQGVNSCMISITSCQDWEITTIEKIGNRLEGYHPLQTTLADANGSQCGHCSPGFIMNMYSLLKSKKLTMLEIERSLGSNVCRCTGYRSILDAFKKFASDAPKSRDVYDIEDLNICERSGKICSKVKCDQSEWCFVSGDDVRNEVLHIEMKDKRDWYRAETVSDIFSIWQEKGTDSYMLVAGNTGKGAYPILEYPKLLIDISGVSELKGFYIDQNLVIGAGKTLAETIDIFKTLAHDDDFRYLNVLNEHMELVANVTIRNMATLAGNLSIKNQHPDFKSDIFLLLETVGAQVNIAMSPGKSQIMSMKDFLQKKMKGKVILNIIMPPLNMECNIVTYKIMQRSQNAHALIHAGFFYQIDASHVVHRCRIVYGCLSPTFVRASKTEQFLVGKVLFVNETLQAALAVLDEELVVVEDLPDSPAQYRRRAALGLFYKGLLTLCPVNILNPRYLSGVIKLFKTRPVSKSLQVFDTDPSLWPLGQPLPKLEGLIQCAGEAKYTEDISSIPGEVFCAFVLAKIGLGTIKKIDASKALTEPGVLAFYSAADIQGVNSFVPAPNLFNLANEELFCDGEVKYYDQVIGVIVAECQSTAERAAALVQVEYTNTRKPLIDIKLAKNDPSKTTLFYTAAATNVGNNVVRIIKGNNTIHAQYHFPLETMVCITHPTEDGLRMYASTQWLDTVHQTTSRLLNLDQSRIEVIVRRLGGAYGLKITRCTQVAAASALAAYKLNRPCRFVNSLTNNMRSSGKRLPCSRDFEVGVDAKGVIQYVNYDLYSDNGYIVNEPLLALGLDNYYNCYNMGPWKYTSYNCITDTASNTWCRSPGTLENIAMAESMMERIAYELNIDPLEVRLANLDMNKYGDIKDMTEILKKNALYPERKIAVDLFNSNNRWKKRGLNFSFMRWSPYGFQNFEINLSVYSDDGTVVITFGGVEMGQGINTKATQICAYFLNIPIEKIQIKPNDTVIAPNGTTSGGSTTTQNVGIGVRRCCEELLRRLEPVRAKMNNPTWAELVKEAYSLQVDLQVHDYTTSSDAQYYNIYGVTLLEVEIDVLTGEKQIVRVDLIEDVGQSVNPEIDMGQIEGAFIMSIGYWTSENLVYDPSTGELLTNRTWDYWVPQATDIPQDFRVYQKKRSYSSDIILGSKAVGEPASCMGIVVAFAIRAAISAARRDSGIPNTQWFDIDGPFSVEKTCVSCATRVDEFKFY